MANDDQDVPGGPTSGEEKEEPGVIYTCKFPGCKRQYASTDGVRKHCRKSHPDWLRQVDLEKERLGCRWAAYCTRHVIDEGTDDPRITSVGSKRAREIMAVGNAQYNGAFRSSILNPAKVSSDSGASELPPKPPPKPREAFGDRGTLVPPKPHYVRSSAENKAPSDLIFVPSESSTRLPEASKLTPNAQARQRLGEFADHEGCAASVPRDGGFFAWGMPPLKRGLSLADTRDAITLASYASSLSPVAQEANFEDDASSYAPPSRNESFVDSIIA